MSFTATSLSAACGVNDTTILVASLTGFSVGQLARIDNEYMKVLEVPAAATTPVRVLRGQDGTAQVAHASSARVITGNTASAAGTDWNQPAAGGPAAVPLQTGVQRVVKTYTAAGAITVPDVGTALTIAIINGTGALAMTLANPSTAQDGDILVVAANGKAAHTLTITSGLGNGGASFDVGTFSASIAGGCTLMAMGGFWVCIGNGILGATAATGAPLWA